MKYPRGIGTRTSELSKLYVTNMNYFGQCDGFTSIYKRINGDMPGVTVTLLEIQNYISLCRDASGVFHTKFAKEYFPRFQDALFRRLQNLTTSDLKELQDADKTLVDVMLRDVEVLLKATLKDFPIYEYIGTQVYDALVR